MRDSTLLISKLPVDSSTFGVADHHSSCCLSVGTRGKHDKVFISSLVVEPSFLARVYWAIWDSPDAEMRKLARRAHGSHA